MRKVVFSVLMIVLLCTLTFLGSLGAQEAFASSARAASATITNCVGSGGCFAKQYWNGNMQGMQVNTTVSDPGLVNSTSAWQRDFEVFDYIQGHAAVHAGFVKSRGVAVLCPATNRVNFYTYVTYIDGTSSGVICDLTSSGDINHPVEIQIYQVGSSMTVNMIGAVTNLFQQWTGNIETTYNRIQYYHYVNDQVTGHKMWGVSDVYNKWFSYPDQLFYPQTRNSDYGPAFNKYPWPLMYWRDVPAPGNNGGRLENCIYETVGSPATCTDGS